MIVGGYTMDLYCDFPDETWEHRSRIGKRGFFAETGGQARAMARRAGWTLDLKAGTALCPYCRQKGRTL